MGFIFLFGDEDISLLAQMFYDRAWLPEAEIQYISQARPRRV